MKIEDLKIYLPKFLSAESDHELFAGLKDFPNNIDTRLYTNFLTESEIIYQGDGINDMLVINLPNPEIKPVPSIVLSNTCDIDLINKRNFPSQLFMLLFLIWGNIKILFTRIPKKQGNKLIRI